MKSMTKKPDVTFDLHEVVDRELHATADDLGRLLKWPVAILALAALMLASGSLWPLFWLALFAGWKGVRRCRKA